MSPTAACVVRCCRASLTTLNLDNQDYRVSMRGDHQEIDDVDANIYGLCDLVDELKQCQRLTDFSLKLATPWFPEVFEKFSACPGLIDLDVYLSSEDSPSYEWEDHPPRYGDYHFPALRRLRLHGVSFGDVMDILESKEENPDDAPFREMEVIGICGGPGDSSGALIDLRPAHDLPPPDARPARWAARHAACGCGLRGDGGGVARAAGACPGCDAELRGGHGVHSGRPRPLRAQLPASASPRTAARRVPCPSNCASADRAIADCQ
ncbi:hypothetical protein K523DRAFT_149138 [Schizophyllum commune Tattone D]|nr:hypothetical protein K523DRAFT_149138 [Schizophyllum commune Tattone D]